MLKTVIMAGGVGQRLRPLTCNLPKPLAPLCGAPIMSYGLDLLRRHGIDQAAVTLWYKPEDVISAFGSEWQGVRLSYVIEKEPVGTAGSVLMAAREARNTVLVLSGDGLTAVDLRAALAFHKARRAAATLVLRHVDIPLPYGVVVADGEGRITRFIEKPDWSRVISSLVNTGVYLLEPEALALIPPDKPFDFGRDLFPLMLQRGLPLYGYQSPAYWCDVGSPAAFLQAQADLLSGQAGLSPFSRGRQGAGISADSYVAPDAQVADGAVITRSCVLPGAVIGANARLDGAIVCSGARVEQGAALQSGSVLGAGAVAGAFCRLTGNARIDPGIRLPAHCLVSEPVAQGTGAVTVAGGAAQADTPAQLTHLAGAFLQSQRAQTVAVMDAGGGASYHLLLGALAAYGAARVWALGRGSLGLLSHAVLALHADGGLLCTADGVLLVDKVGLLLDERAGAAVQEAARAQQLPAPALTADVLRPHAALRAAYLRQLADDLPAARGVSVRLLCPDRALRALAGEALRQAGHTVAEDAPIALALSQRAARLHMGDHVPASLQQWLLCARALARLGLPVYDTDDLALASLPAPDDSPACLHQRRVLQDGVARVLLLCALFAQESPQDALSALPALARRTADIPCDAASKGRVLEALLPDAAPRAQGGLHAQRGGARAVIRPDPVLPLMHVAVSARNAEYAQELCDFYAGKVRRVLYKGE